MDINSEESSTISDADPQLVIDSLKGMDDLDAELFGNKNKQNLREPKKENPKMEAKPKAKSGGRKVTFQSSLPSGGDDFDLDDPLAGLLSDADSNFSENKKDFQIQPAKKITSTSAASKASKKKKDTDEVVFDDDSDDLLMALDDNRNAQFSTSKTPKGKPSDASSTKPSAKSQGLPSKKPTSSSKYHFDKDGNLVLDQPSTPNVEDISFGTYQPSTASKPQRSLGTNRRPSPVPRQTEDDFLNFLTDEMETHSKSRGRKATGIAPTKTEKPMAEPTISQKPSSRPHDFLGLGDEVDLGLDDHSSPLPSVAANAPPTFQTNHAAASKTKDKPSTPSSTARRNIASPAIPQHPPPLDSPPLAIKTKPSSPQLQSRNETDLFNFDEPPKLTSPLSRSPPLRRPLSSTLTQPSPIDRHPQTTAIGTVNSPPVGDYNSKVELLEAQLSHARKLLHETQHGFQRDLDLATETYDNRVQALQGSINDMKLRSDREVESIKESYNVRLEAVRSQIRHHFDEVSERDSIEHEEIKRLRALHLTALEDTRLDYDHQTKRLKETHAKDMEALKASTVYVRNLESMMQKVDHASEQLATLSSKYEVALHAMTDKWSGMATQNKQFMSAVQGKLDDMQRSNAETQNNIQQTASRLEGNISEMNRTFRDQQYHMQLEHTRLETAQTSLQHERKSLHQQVAAERAEAMKAHKEAIDLRQGYEREARDNDERLRHREEEMRLSQRVLEEARSAEREQSSQRERERRMVENDLARQQAAQVEKSEKLSVLEARLMTQKEEFERRHAALVQLEQRLQEKEEKVKQREEEAKESEQRNAKKVAESIQAFQEAKRVEREHASRMSELHTEANEIAKQRQLLAEERKTLVEDRLTYQPPPNFSPTKHPHHELTPSKLTNSERIRNPHTPNRSGSNTALWLFTAQKDRDFLEDEEIFLETLKSPHGQQGAVES